MTVKLIGHISNFNRVRERGSVLILIEVVEALSFSVCSTGRIRLGHVLALLLVGQI